MKLVKFKKDTNKIIIYDEKTEKFYMIDRYYSDCMHTESYLCLNDLDIEELLKLRKGENK